jgi:SAM-dependent MidA family methyltransferase
VNQLTEIIAAELRNQGVLSFARFMELALYCPVYGYYEKEADTIGRRGDYYTSVSVGPLFGELLACQFADWLQVHGPSSTTHCLRTGSVGRLRIVEAGAHDAHLARDILDWLRRQRASLFERLEYWLVEPSATRKERQAQSLHEFAGKTRWVRHLAELGEASSHTSLSTRSPAPSGTPGQPDSMPVPSCQTEPAATRAVTRSCGAQLFDGTVLFSNELLDAFPVHRLGWDAAQQTWFEWGVTIRNGRFEFTRMAGHPPFPFEPLCGVPSLNGSPELPHAHDVLPDGFVLEARPAASQWWRQAATLLQRGKLLTIDYGLTGQEFCRPERINGTLRAYARHQPSLDVLACPGEQDLTAHVDFTALRTAGEAAGLKTDALLTQPQFLTRIAKRIWTGAVGFGEWTSSDTRQFQTLTHPEHLGRGFRVLVQSAGNPK